MSARANTFQAAAVTATATATGGTGGRHLVLDTRRIALVLAAVACALAVVGAFVNVYIYQIAASPEADLARVLARFDLGHEPSIPAWFSANLLLLDGAMLLVTGFAAVRAGERFAVHWLVLGAIFVALSADEAALFHEMLDTALAAAIDRAGFTRGGVFLFPWVVAGALFGLAVALAYARFLLHLPVRVAALFVGSGALYVGGAVGMELASSQAISGFGLDSLAHTATQTVEESMEMAGAILFFFALGEHWRWRHGPLRLATAPAAPPRGEAGTVRRADGTEIV